MPGTFGAYHAPADALMFILLHEVGHVLLRQWEHPFYENEEVADEFVTVLIVMFGQEDRARAQAEYFAALPTSKEFKHKLARDDRHPLSVQRAQYSLLGGGPQTRVQLATGAGAAHADRFS